MSKLTRKEFLKGAAVGAIGVAAMGVMGTASAAEAAVVAPDASGSWLGEEPVTAEDVIVETVEADAIVIGLGTSGAYVAASCLEHGWNTVVIEKNAMPGTLRNDWGAIGSKYQIAEGTEIDKRVAMHYHAMYCSHRLDQRLPRIWAEESGAAIDWAGGILEKYGATYLHEAGYESDFGPTTYPKFPTGHSGHFPAGLNGATIFQQYITELGGEIRFETPFVKFEYEGKKVTAAIAQNENGEYIRLIGAKGLFLCTGGYQQNPGMMQALQPEWTMVMGPINAGATCGDGIKACLWMGADMDETHSSLAFDRRALYPDETPATASAMGFFYLGSQPWLKVNLKGERFFNESGPYDFATHAAASQPGKCYVCVLDANWWEQVQQFQTVGCSRAFPFPNGAPNDGQMGASMEELRERQQTALDSLVENGFMKEADTLEELAEKMNLPAETFVATVNRYNELCAKGDDEDFYKDAYRLAPIDTPPFRAVRNTTMILSTMDGIRIDTYMRPVDIDGEPFEGLYVMGDSSGNYFAYTYPNLFTGYAHGRTCTFALRAVRYAAGEEVKDYTILHK